MEGKEERKEISLHELAGNIRALATAIIGGQAGKRSSAVLRRNSAEAVVDSRTLKARNSKSASTYYYQMVRK